MISHTFRYGSKDNLKQLSDDSEFSCLAVDLLDYRLLNPTENRHAERATITFI